MEQGYPTREQAEAMVQNRCPTMICANCKVNRWCGEDGVKVSKSAGESFLAMHDELTKARDLVRRIVDRLVYEKCNPTCLVWVNNLKCDNCPIHKLKIEAEAMTKEDKP
jgi:hypothetical protein